jgi:hypothetical protein
MVTDTMVRKMVTVTISLFVAACAAQTRVPGDVRFALMGDTPYSEQQVGRLDRLIADLNGEDLAFVVHIGDITSGKGPCSDDWFRERREQFARIKHPFILLPGDNDWTDCHRSGYSPTERLAHWRKLFCTREPRLRLEVQRGEYCEHIRWRAGGWVFVALNVQGSNNNLGRNAAMDAEHLARMKAVLAWIDDSERVMHRRRLARIVLLMQANPFEKPRSGENGFAALLERMQKLVAANPGAVILVNGDTHLYRDDQPMPGLRRIEPWGSPIVSWLRGSISRELHVGVAGLY